MSRLFHHFREQVHSVKMSEFSATQILREINCGESRGYKTAIFAILVFKKCKTHKIHTSERLNLL